MSIHMDVEKTIQFLLDQRARFDARQARLEARFEEWLGRRAEDMSRINAVLLDVATAQERTNQIVGTLAEKHFELAESHWGLAEAQQATEEKLHALILTLERHPSNHN